MECYQQGKDIGCEGASCQKTSEVTPAIPLLPPQLHFSRRSRGERSLGGGSETFRFLFQDGRRNSESRVKRQSRAANAGAGATSQESPQGSFLCFVSVARGVWSWYQSLFLVLRDQCLFGYKSAKKASSQPIFKLELVGARLSVTSDKRFTIKTASATAQLLARGILDRCT